MLFLVNDFDPLVLLVRIAGLETAFAFRLFSLDTRFPPEKQGFSAFC
jgi:hypothetical protein